MQSTNYLMVTNFVQRLNTLVYPDEIFGSILFAFLLSMGIPYSPWYKKS